MALNGLFCADVPLRNYSLNYSLTHSVTHTNVGIVSPMKITDMIWDNFACTVLL